MNSESQPFSVGVFPNGQPEKHDIDAEYLKDKGFESADDNLYSKEIHPGKSLLYNLSTAEILVKNGDNEQVMVAENERVIATLAHLYSTVAGHSL